MTERMQYHLVLHGVAVFMIGLAAGFPLAFIETGVELWGVTLPLIGHWEIPGSIARWKMTHLEGIINGILCLAVAGIGARLAMGGRLAGFVTVAVIVTAWVNTVASLSGALFGGRGLDYGLGTNNDINYNLFIVGIVLIPMALAAIGFAAWRRLRAG